MAMPPLNSVILAGGASRRMGRDKALFRYHGEPQIRHLATMLGALTDTVCLSVREKGDGQEYADLRLLPDRDPGVGPLEGILRAFEADPAAAWLVIAVDMPNVAAETLARLVASRDPSCSATAYRNPRTGQPEPVLAIYEPRILPLLRQRKAQGRYSLMLLQDLPVRLLDVEDPRELSNINTPDDYDAFLRESSARS